MVVLPGHVWPGGQRHLLDLPDRVGGRGTVGRPVGRNAGSVSVERQQLAEGAGRERWGTGPAPTGRAIAPMAPIAPTGGTGSTPAGTRTGTRCATAIADTAAGIGATSSSHTPSDQTETVKRRPAIERRDRYWIQIGVPSGIRFFSRLMSLLCRRMQPCDGSPGTSDGSLVPWRPTTPPPGHSLSVE